MKIVAGVKGKYADYIVPVALSNFTFNWCKSLATKLHAKYPSITYRQGDCHSSEYAMKVIIESAKTPENICKDLNKSGLGYNTWKVVHNNQSTLHARDNLGNEYFLFI